MRFPLIKTTLLTALVLGMAGVAVLAAAADFPSPSQVYERPPAEYVPSPPDTPAPNQMHDGSGGDWYPEGTAAGSESSDEGGGFLNRLCGPCNGPRWTFSGEVLALQRTSSGHQPLFLDDATGNVSLTSGDLDFPVDLGLQASAVRHHVFGSCFDIEVGYFQMDWTLNSASPAGGNGLVDSIFGSDPTGPEFIALNNGASVRYTSGLHLGEINLRREWFDGLTLLAGFRTGELDEHYSVNGSDSFAGAYALNTNTFNHLYGFQVGADMELCDTCQPLQVHVLCKAGIYGNSSSQKNHVTDSTFFLDDTLSANRCQTMFMGETGVVLSYRVNCHLSFRASATATWLEGVALAPQQVGNNDFVSDTATVNSDSAIFYYGGGLGAEVKF